MECEQSSMIKKRTPPPIFTDATSEVEEAELSYSNL
jgi:hypothetical protein